MANEKRASPSAYGYSDEYEYLRICPTCYELYETARPDGEEQRCTCRPAGKRWPHRDFNQRAMLCRCCGLNVLPSGSRWSPYFCRECRLLAMGVSVWNRRLVFPTGRHSLMHAWVPKTPSAARSDHGNEVEAQAAGVHAALQGIEHGSDGLWHWYALVMPRNLQHFGLEGDVSLLEYLEAVAAGAPALSTRLEAFDGLCRFFQPSLRESERKN